MMPTQLKYKLVVAFCLMSVVPILVGLYIASLFIQFPFVANTSNLMTISLVTGVSLFLSFLGYFITQQLLSPIIQAANVARNIASGQMSNETIESKGSEELEDLSRSLRTISSNARELLDKVEKLSQKDKLTGLYNASYIRERLNEEIQRAIHYQRPCSFVYLAITNFEAYATVCGAAASEDALKAVAAILNGHLNEFDRAARISKNEFALIHPDKNKKKSIEAVLKIKAEVQSTLYLKTMPEAARIGIVAGISENPLDGMTGQQLFLRAEDRAMKALAAGDNGIEAFA